MNVILFGASGMVGQGVLRECLLDPAVGRVLVIGRAASGNQHAKLREILRPDVGDLASSADEFTGYDACFFCLGVSSSGMKEADYRRVTHDLTLAAAETLAKRCPDMTFVYVSGAGTDSTERGRTMWARVKGATENALLRLPFKAAYMFRPGIIEPLDGIVSKTRMYRALYAVMGPVIFLLKRFAPDSMTTTRQMGRAMIAVVRRQPAGRILETREINRL